MNDTIKTNILYILADEARKRATDETELESQDVTQEFYRGLIQITQHKGLLNINVNGSPTTGKSITAMAIAQKLKQQLFNTPFGLNDIDRDQQEYSEKMRKGLKNQVRVIDEWNSLETTGENSTAEEGLLEYMSDVFAQRMCHKISCSPTMQSDKNAYIFLQMIPSDKTSGYNYAKLYYLIHSPTGSYEQLIGHVKINVTPVLKTKWYEKYRERKFEKMELIEKEGIFRPRFLKYASVILYTVNTLKLQAKYGIINTRMTKNYIVKKAREQHIILSVFGKKELADEAQGILDHYITYWELDRRLKQTQKKFQQGKLLQTSYELQRVQITEVMQTTLTNAKELEAELEKMKKINDKYNEEIK